MNKILGLGALGAVALLLFGSKGAHASPASTAPPVGPGATVENLPAPASMPGVPALKRTMWHVAAGSDGQQAGVFILVQSAKDPNDWVLTFKNDAGGGAGIVAYAQTPIGGLLAQAVAAGL